MKTLSWTLILIAIAFSPTIDRLVEGKPIPDDLKRIWASCFLIALGMVFLLTFFEGGLYVH